MYTNKSLTIKTKNTTKDTYFHRMSDSIKTKCSTL